MILFGKFWSNIGTSLYSLGLISDPKYAIIYKNTRHQILELNTDCNCRLNTKALDIELNV